MRAAGMLAQFRALPVRDADTLIGAGPVMILAPHADDESLGCGGLIATSVERSAPPQVLIMTDGTGSHPKSRTHPPPVLRALRQQEAREAVAILGLPATRLGFLGLRDTAAPMDGPAFQRAVAAVEARCRAAGIATLLAPWAEDPHGDHVAVHRMAVAVAARLTLPHWAYPVWGWTLPDDSEIDGSYPDGMRLDITGQFDRKWRAIQAHRSQYGGLITDDPEGFSLPQTLLNPFREPFETFLRLG